MPDYYSDDSYEQERMVATRKLVECAKECVELRARIALLTAENQRLRSVAECNCGCVGGNYSDHNLSCPTWLKGRGDRLEAENQRLKALRDDTLILLSNAARQRDVLDQQSKLLRAALRWCLENGAKQCLVWDEDADGGTGDSVPGIRNAGCDCCSHKINPPPEFAPLIAEAVEQEQAK
jgi:hypothetical protein